MADNLTIFGTTYNNVTGIKATDTNGVVQTFVKGGSPTPTPAPSSIASGAKFIDYDGTVLYTYSTAEALALSALPANPSHTGLTAQGWNWSLANIKAYLTKYPDGIANVGQMYVTDDGKTRVYIHLGERRSPVLGVCPNGTVDVDWGDGTTHDTLTGTSTSTVKWTPTHNYAASGDYVIKLTVTGSMGFYGSSETNQFSGLLRYSSGTDARNRYYISVVNRIEIGENVTNIGAYAFYYCYSLTNLTIPDGVTSIGNNAFYGCYSLTNLTIPDGVTYLGNSAFYFCYALTSLTIPDSITSIGDSTFRNCYSLTSLTIPDDVTSIGSSAFYYCYSLTNLTIPDGVTSIGSSAFGYCYSITSLTIPDGVTSIGSSAFYYCYSLTSLTIPDDVTSIGNYAFGYCYSLTSLTIPDDVTSIGGYAFGYCFGIAEYHFLPTTPQTLVDTTPFNGIPDDCIIYVPYSADHSVLNAYKTASNWSTYADNMQEEPQS